MKKTILFASIAALFIGCTKYDKIYPTNVISYIDNITGFDSIIVGQQHTLSDNTSGGVWSSSNDNIASINSNGLVTANNVGSCIISYVLDVDTVYKAIHVINTPVLPDAGVISGFTTVDVGSTITMSENVSGGVWTKWNNIVSISQSGVVTGISEGSTFITYTVSNAYGSSFTTKIINVNLNPGYINGASVVDVGKTTLLTETVNNGVWSSSDNSIANINSAGLVAGVSVGNVTITYAVVTSSSIKFATKGLSITNTANNIHFTNDVTYVKASSTQYNYTVYVGIKNNSTQTITLNNLNIVCPSTYVTFGFSPFLKPTINSGSSYDNYALYFSENAPSGTTINFTLRFDDTNGNEYTNNFTITTP